MKTLKRSLALLLALLLALGTMAVAASATDALDAFQDGEKVSESYKTAAEVLVNLGIIEGDEGGLRPNDTITRAEACKIICFALIGPDAREMEDMQATSTYDDIAGDEWYAMYVTYCTEKGIVSGDNGDGTGDFRPNDPITGYEFAKICMTGGIGLDSEYEGFESGIWQLEIKQAAAKQMIDEENRINMLYNLPKDFNWAANVTRQVAFQLAFNALQVVRKNKNFANDGKTCVGYLPEDDEDTSVLDGVYSARKVDGVVDYVPAGNDTPAYYIVATEDADVPVENVFHDLIGAPAGVWMREINGKQVAISDVDLNWEVVGTATNPTEFYLLTTKTINDKANPSFCGYEIDDDVIVNINGVVEEEFDVEDEEIGIKNGDLVVLCALNGSKTINFIYIQRYEICLVTDKVAVDNTNKTVTVPGVVEDVSVDAITGYEDLVKGQWVYLYSWIEGAEVEIWTPEASDIAGAAKLTKLGNNEASNPYYDNTAYKYSGYAKFNYTVKDEDGNDVVKTDPPTTSELNGTFTVIKDWYGYVIVVADPGALPEAETTDMYGLLMAYQANGYKKAGAAGSFSQGTAEKAAVEQAIIYSLADGKNVLYDFNTAVDTRFQTTDYVASADGNFLFGEGTGENDGKLAAGAAVGDYRTDHLDANYIVELTTLYGNNPVVKYTVDNETGKIVAIEIVDTTAIALAQDAQIVKGKALELADGYASSGTKFVYYTFSFMTNSYGIATYTGYANAPTLNLQGLSAVGNKIAIAVGNAPYTPAPVTVVYLNDVAHYTTSKTTTQPVQTRITLNAYVNGALTEITISNNENGELNLQPGFYKGTNNFGVYTLSPLDATDEDALIGGELDQKEADFFVVDGKAVYFNSNTKFYQVSGFGGTYTITADTEHFAMVNGHPVTIVKIFTDAQSGVATEVYYSVA